MNDENRKYLDNLPLRLMALAAQAAEVKHVTVVPKVIQGHPGFVFTFPPDHTDHDSDFHAPHPHDYELHVMSAQCYVVEVENELKRLTDEQRIHDAQLARGKELLRTLTQADLAALKLVIN